jgi:hypothetical protein
MPAVLGFAEIALREKHHVSSSRFKSAMLDLTTYRAIDPTLKLNASGCNSAEIRVNWLYML